MEPTALEPVEHIVRTVKKVRRELLKRHEAAPRSRHLSCGRNGRAFRSSGQDALQSAASHVARSAFRMFHYQLHARARVLTVMRLLVCATLLFVLSQYQVDAGDVAHVVSATIFMNGFGDMFASLGFIAGGFGI